jgi:hypothetical protein
MTLQDTQSQETDAVTQTDQPGATQADGELQQTDTSGIGVNGDQKPERTYTQTEVTRIQARADQREAQGRRAVAEAALQVDVANAAAVEERAQGADKQRVDNGELTFTEATSRSERRMQGLADTIRANSDRQQEDSARERGRAQSDFGVRFAVAARVAKESKVDLDDLNKWVAENNPDHPRLIELQAREMALSKREASTKGTERYDGNKQGTRGLSLDRMSPQEKIAFGLRRDK